MCIRLFLYFILLFNMQLYAAPIELVQFLPPLFLNDWTECQAVRISDDTITMTKECINAERISEESNRLVQGVRWSKKGVLGTNYQKITDNRSRYLENVTLISFSAKKKAESPFAQDVSGFELGVSPNYKIKYIKDGKVAEVKTELNTFGYPFTLVGTSNQLSLPSGAAILDKNGKIHCLLESDGSCTSLNDSRTGLIKEMQGVAARSAVMAPSDGDCCNPATHEIYLHCITYCARFPHLCERMCERSQQSDSPPNLLMVANAITLAFVLVALNHGFPLLDSYLFHP